jgi:hypothetical protein
MAKPRVVPVKGRVGWRQRTEDGRRKTVVGGRWTTRPSGRDSGLGIRGQRAARTEGRGRWTEGEGRRAKGERRKAKEGGTVSGLRFPVSGLKELTPDLRFSLVSELFGAEGAGFWGVWII